MFLDEARLAARISHPNVVQTLDVVATGGELFLVMEYVPGESIARLARALRERQQAIPLRILSAVMAGVAPKTSIRSMVDSAGISLRGP